MDYATDENFKRREGEPFDPLFFRSGEALDGGWYRVEEDYFLDRPYREGAEPGEWIEFEWMASATARRGRSGSAMCVSCG